MSTYRRLKRAAKLARQAQEKAALCAFTVGGWSPRVSKAAEEMQGICSMLEQEVEKLKPAATR
jgi:hypothetical protein